MLLLLLLLVAFFSNSIFVNDNLQFENMCTHILCSLEFVAAADWAIGIGLLFGGICMYFKMRIWHTPFNMHTRTRHNVFSDKIVDT